MFSLKEVKPINTEVRVWKTEVKARNRELREKFGRMFYLIILIGRF